MSVAEKPVEVFYSYAHADKRGLKRLDTHLALLKRQGLISAWYDREIVAGTERAEEIDVRLNRAAVILLLISPDFLASDYCYGTEMKRALAIYERVLGPEHPTAQIIQANYQRLLDQH